MSTLHQSSSSSRMHVINHNWSATKQHLHPQSVAEISRHSVLSGDRIRQCETSSGSRHKDTTISVCKSQFPSAGTAVSLFCAKTVQQRPLLPRKVETWLPDCVSGWKRDYRLWLSSSRYTVPRTRNKLNDKSIFCCWTHDLEQPTAVRSWLLTAFCVAHFFGDSWISFVLSLSVLSVAYMHVTNVKQMTDFIRT